MLLSVVLAQSTSPYYAAVGELVRMFEPSGPSSTSRTGCPHDQSGLVSWHNAATWASGVPPSAGAHVTLPQGQKVLLSRDVGYTLGLVTIPATSELIIGENSSHGVALNMAGMQVDGALRAGAQTCRLTTRVTITLFGARPPTKEVRDALPPTFKGIVVSSTGSLDLHGQRFYRTWTRLAAPVSPGDTTVYLQRAVNWEPGQQVLLTTTALKDARDYHRNEVLVLSRLLSPPAGVGAALQLTSAARYAHGANGAWQGEVALLSRRIVVQGSAADSEPTDTTPIACTTSRWALGSNSVPCANSFLTGFGGHVLVMGQGRVSGVEFFRMGQTNQMARYPMHFHFVGNAGTGGTRASMRDSSVHRSFYRCVSVHGTNNALISENVAYDAIGHCFYLEDGIEQDNTFEYNLASFVHPIGMPAAISTSGQFCEDIVQSDTLTLPADSAAAGFYITNGHNTIVGNAASGGWAGFALPQLDSPIMSHRSSSMKPSRYPLLRFEGNSAHSSGFWWASAGMIYFGGKLWHTDVNTTAPPPNTTAPPPLRYNPCRQNPARVTCAAELESWGGCPAGYEAATRITETKVFLGAFTGVSHWGSAPEIVGYEAHDVGLSASILGYGFLNRVLVRCRTGAALQVPCEVSGCNVDTTLASMGGTGFIWYDTAQAHIFTNATFRRCGVRASGSGGTEVGCGTGSSGCSARSSVWAFLTHSDQFAPQFMQATKGIRYENTGLRFRMTNFVADNGGHLHNGMSSSVSGRLQNWYDADGTAAGLRGPLLLGSAPLDGGKWWHLDDACVMEPLSRLWQCGVRGTRTVGSVLLQWYEEQARSLGRLVCGNGQIGMACTPVGYVKHWGSRYATGAGKALPLTRNGLVTGVTGGYGWHVAFTSGTPRVLNLTQIQVPHTTKLLISIAYPASVDTINVTAMAPSWCYPWQSAQRRCTTAYTRVASIAE
ncbi:communication mutant protein, partial [Chrysochromulina tobinii]